jgi:hypothetical protein
MGTFSVAFASSVYSGGIAQTEHDLRIGREVAILGVALFVLGFGLGFVRRANSMSTSLTDGNVTVDPFCLRR